MVAKEVSCDKQEEMEERKHLEEEKETKNFFEKQKNRLEIDERPMPEQEPSKWRSSKRR